MNQDPFINFSTCVLQTNPISLDSVSQIGHKNKEDIKTVRGKRVAYWEDMKEKGNNFMWGKEGRIEFPRSQREVSCYFGDKPICLESIWPRSVG